MVPLRALPTADTDGRLLRTGGHPMTGMDMLLASLTPVQLAQFHVEDATEELIRALDEMEAAWQAWLIENLEKRTRE
jgi:hypothetical protein